jgi:GrpB-like predicted nucleotidyltransferase (UPF0157 family)
MQRIDRIPEVPPDPIIVVEYDPEWPRTFDILRLRLARALGNLAVAIEHIGSTAVPGLAAKPIIDIDVVLHTQADLPPATAAIDDLGYHHRDDFGIEGMVAFHWPPRESRHHVYACITGCVEFKRHVLFRNFLRRHIQVTQAYASLKHDLARRFRDDRIGYNRAKTEFVEDVLRQADGDGAMASRVEAS